MSKNNNIEFLHIGMAGITTYRQNKNQFDKRSMREPYSNTREVTPNNIEKFQREYNNKQQHVDEDSLNIKKHVLKYSPMKQLANTNLTTDDNMNVRERFAKTIDNKKQNEALGTLITNYATKQLTEK